MPPPGVWASLTAASSGSMLLSSFRVLPALGQFVAGDRGSYRYLAESIRRFPAQAAFAAMITDAGLGQVRWRDLSGGIAALHSAWRL